MNTNRDPTSTDSSTARRQRRIVLAIAATVGLATAVVAALLVSIWTRKHVALTPFIRLVDVNESTTNPAVWDVNWPRQYKGYLRTIDQTCTRHGGSDAIPPQKFDADPWLKTMWAGYAFSLDYRERRGHAYMLADQKSTERVKQRPQFGVCLQCHASVIPAYRELGGGDMRSGFEKLNAMPYHEACHVTGVGGKELIQHPNSCVDYHDSATMALRVTRPAFIEGIAALKRSQGVADYDVHRDATRQNMRTFVCAQCHVQYYFKGTGKTVTYPRSKGTRIEEIEAHYDEIGFSDWTHGITGAKALKGAASGV